MEDQVGKWKWDEMIGMNRTGERAEKNKGQMGDDASHDYTEIRTCGLSTLSLISLHVRWWASCAWDPQNLRAYISHARLQSQSRHTRVRFSFLSPKFIFVNN